MECGQCGVDLPDEAFYPQPNKRGRKCKTCCAIQDRALKIVRKYGITAEEFITQLEYQDGKCACCGKSLRIGVQGSPGALFDGAVIDHDHNTGKVRGILCGQCNIGIGKLGDDLDGVKRAYDYLASSQWHSTWEQLELNLFADHVTSEPILDIIV